MAASLQEAACETFCEKSAPFTEGFLDADKTPTHRPHGHTEAGNTRDLKVERVGKVTIYKRGNKYYLYYRQGGVSQRRKPPSNSS